ncbi:protein translocase subunit SecF [Jatrophihabitans fulvus]
MALPKIFTDLYRGETRIPFVQTRKRWYIASAIVMLICILSLVFRGFNFGVAFAGGTTVQIKTNDTSISTNDVNQAFIDAGVEPDGATTEAGDSSNRQLITNVPDLTPAKQQQVEASVSKAIGVNQDQFTSQSISSSWGRETTVKALQGLAIFLVAVTIYIALWFQWRMAVGALAALLFDLLITAGIYSVIGFEVTPSTVVGLLTILGFSLYDTVVVYDKITENAKDILAGSRTTYTEAANLAVNQTLMRSINTSLIGLLPVAGLLFVGAGVLGVGTIKDLALILFVGLASGAYSSLFLAAPIVVDLTEREPQYKALTKRVAAKRSSDRKRADATGDASPADGELVTAGADLSKKPARTGGPAPAPRPGARPQRRKR